jgi:hypothetical protein
MRRTLPQSSTVAPFKALLTWVIVASNRVDKAAAIDLSSPLLGTVFDFGGSSTQVGSGIVRKLQDADRSQ